MYTKVCSKCKIEKSVNEFYKREYGYGPHCKNCLRAQGAFNRAERDAMKKDLLPDGYYEQKDELREKYFESSRKSASGVKYVVHHIIPFCEGGTHSCDNVEIISEEEHKKKHFEMRRRKYKQK